MSVSDIIVVLNYGEKIATGDPQTVANDPAVIARILRRRLPLLKVEGVSAHYDGVQALWSVSFEVKEGEIVALVGSNGAGKTTMLRAISRLLPVSEGSIELADRDLARAGSHDVVAAGVAHVPEARQLFPMMTVRENLELGAYLPEAAQPYQRVAGARL